VEVLPKKKPPANAGRLCAYIGELSNQYKKELGMLYKLKPLLSIIKSIQLNAILLG